LEEARTQSAECHFENDAGLSFWKGIATGKFTGKTDGPILMVSFTGQFSPNRQN